jgi:hypothetical protein
MCAENLHVEGAEMGQQFENLEQERHGAKMRARWRRWCQLDRFEFGRLASLLTPALVIGVDRCL